MFDQVGVKPGEIPVVGWGNSLDTTQEVLNGYVNAAQWQDPQATSYIGLSLAAMAAGGIPPGFNVITGALYEKDTAQRLRRHPVGQVDRAIRRRGGDAPRRPEPCRDRRSAPPSHRVTRSVEQRSLLQRLIARPEFGPFVLLVVELVVFWAINHDFLSPRNISNTLTFTVELGLIALADDAADDVGRVRPLGRLGVRLRRRCVMWTLFNTGVTSLELGLPRRAGGRRADRPRQRLVRHPAQDPVLPGDARHAAGRARHRAVHHRRLSAAHLERRRAAGSPSSWSATSTSAPFRVYMSLFWFIAAALVLGYVLTQTKAGNWIQAVRRQPQRGAGARRQRRAAPRSRCSC